MSFEITPNTSWNEIASESSITQVLHPLYNNYISKEEFADEFRAILSKFNGQDGYPDSYLGFYVEVNPVNGALKFTDEDSKADFIDYAIEHDLMPPLKDIHEGEDSEKKKERMESDEWNSLQRLNSSEIREIERDILHQKEIDRLASIEIQRKKSFDRSQSHSQFYKDYQMLENIWKGCQKNQEKLSSILSSSNQIEIDRLKKKTAASRFRLEGVYQKFANNYPLSEFHIYPDYHDRMNTVVEEIGDWLGKKL